MTDKAINLPNLEEGDFLEEAYNKEGRLLLSDYEIESKGDLRYLREVNVRYAFVANREPEPGEPPADEETHGEDPTPKNRIEGYKDVRNRYENLLTDASQVFESISEVGVQQEQIRTLRNSLQGLVEVTNEHPDGAGLLTQLKRYEEELHVHSVNVALLATFYGSRQDFGKRDLMKLGMGALLHDVGKMTLPGDILEQDQPLNPRERRLVERHPSEGRKLLRGSPADDTVRRIVHEHHERPDGSGYPRGVEDLHEYSLIISVIEVYETLTSPQPYRDVLPPDRALKKLSEEFNQHDESSRILGNLIQSLGVYPVGCFVQLSTDDIALVVEKNDEASDRPIVKVVGRPDSNREIEQPFEVDLSNLERRKTYQQGKVYNGDVRVKRSFEVAESSRARKAVPEYF